jgi:hypothetical protein
VKEEGSAKHHQAIPGLVSEDLGKYLILNPVELLKGSLKDFAVISGGGVHVFAEAMGCVVHEHFGVFEALGVMAEVQVDEVGVVLDLFQGGAGFVGFALKDLFARNFRHGVDQFGVEEALVAWVGLLGADFQLSDCLRVGDVVVD